MLNWIFDRVAFDDHTERQTMFIENIDQSNVVWFLADEWLSDNFENFMMSVGELNETYIRNVRLNTTSSNIKKISNTTFFKKQLEKPRYLTQLQNYYQSDYQLIESVKFFRK